MKRYVWVTMLTISIIAGSFPVQASEKLVVYCGVTMLKPMVEISKAFEKEQGCKVTFVKGGSGKLLKLLLKNKNGDLFLPGSDTYVKIMDTEHPGLVTSRAHVGFNKAALFVKKGNPKGFTPSLENLLLEEYSVIIGSPEKGSIGKETKKILTQKGIYEKVKEKAVVTMHSQSLVNAVKADKADVTINWFAVSTWPDNVDSVDTLPIDETFAKKKKLILTVLKSSNNPKLANAFLKLVASPKGNSIFQRYGLGL